MARRVCLLAAGVMLAVTGAASAQTQVTFESFTVTNSAQSFTESTLTPNGLRGAPMTRCFGKIETAQMRFRYDGTAPDSSTGILADIGDIVTISGLDNLRRFRIIRTGATSGIVQFQCDRH